MRHKNTRGSQASLASVKLGPVLLGSRILIAEDEPLIAFDLEAAVIERGGAVIGPAYTVADAMVFALGGGVDGAILDMGLRNELATSVIKTLHERGVACVIHTGQTDPLLTNIWPELPVISKPAAPDLVLSVLLGQIQKFRQRCGGNLGSEGGKMSGCGGGGIGSVGPGNGKSPGGGAADGTG